MSEELDEILTRPPGALMRWGITVLACLVLLLLAGAWVIRYPNVIKADIVITTQQPPTRVYSRVAGRISHLLVTDTAMVKVGEVLAEIDNTTHLENVPVLKQLNRQIARFLQQPAATVQIPSPMLTFGDLQTDVSQLIERYQQYQQLIRSPFQAQQTVILRQQITDYRRLVTVNDEQARINGLEFTNTEQKYLADKQLYLEKVYGRLEFLKEENTYLQKKKDNETYRRVAIENGLTLSEREKQLQTLQHDFLEKKQNLANAIRQLISKTENSLITWQQNYIIKAPVGGRLNFLKSLNNQDFIRANDTLFSISQNQQPFVGQATFSVQGIGKLKVGQRVIIRLDDFPYQEYGLLRGTVMRLAPSTDRRQYRAIIALPAKLQTVRIQNALTQTTRSELTGTAELITSDLRLLERAFYGLRGLMQ